MADIKHFAEKLNLVHVNELEESNSISSSIKNIKESDNDLVKDDTNETTSVVRHVNRTADNIKQDQISAQISNDISNSSPSIDEQISEENGNVKRKENTIETATGKKDYSEKNNSETVTDSLDSIITDIKKYMLSDCNLNSIESKQNLLQITQKIRKYLYSTFIQLHDIYLKLLNQKQQFKLIKEKILRISFSSINEVLPSDLSDQLERLVQETHISFLQYLEVNEKCQSVSEAILRKIEKRLKIEKVQKNILEQHNDYFTTLHLISSKNSHLKSAMTASDELENIINCLRRSFRNSENKVDLHVSAIDMAVSSYTEMVLFQNVLDKLFDCINFCLR